MIYFDNAATTWPKPPEVMVEMNRYMTDIGASPGRGSYKRAVAADELVEDTRIKLASLFNIAGDSYQRIVFTLNATEAINLAINGLMLKKGDHIITSTLEHNAVARPVNTLEKKGIEVTRVKCDQEGNISIDDIESSVNENTKLIAITHASNVTGTLMPIKEIGSIAKKKGILFFVDAAQTAGIMDINVQEMNIDLLAFPGHKSLLGPTGTGGLYIKEGIDLKPMKEGGTGSYSELKGMPGFLPDRYEAGTLNTVGLAGLRAGIEFIIKEGIEKIREHELNLAERFLKGALKIPGLKVYGPKKGFERAPVVSFLFEGKNSQKIGEILDKKYDIASRAGLHCSPDAHRALGTFGPMLVRFSFSYYNTAAEVDLALAALNEIAGSY
jgi:cysteine desulfurase family protein